MKFILITLFFALYFTKVFSQLEITSGYAINRNLADGAPLQIAYDLKIKNRLYTKPQIGYKYLYHFNDFVGATLKVSIFEIHQTLSYEVFKKKKYLFKPNIGINYRFYKWKGEMVPPLNSSPIRAWVLGVRDKNYILVSNDEESYKEYKVNNLGFTIQLQNQFRINDKLWFHITPFLEPDYDRVQNTGGCYVGVIFKSL
jgi:hypothetical protein